jgi:hypothetical protein
MVHTIKGFFCKFIEIVQNNTDTNDNDEHIEDDDDETEYEFHTKNINPSLAKLCDISVNPMYTTDTIDSDWNPPSTYGLSNSEPIIQSLYLKTITQALNIDYITHLQNQITDMNPLSRFQLEYIHTLDNKMMFNVIDTYNTTFTIMIQYLTEPENNK